MEKLYSLGTVVKIGDYPINITIIGYYPIDENGYTFDYIGINSVLGLTVKPDMLLFDHSGISEKIYDGYNNEQGEEFLNALQDLKEKQEKESVVE